MSRIEEQLKKEILFLPESRVRDAMEYSLLAGGKRIRPQFLYEVLKGYGCDEEKGDQFACAIEMIHTYSLIHDDLPAMDNDDLRRGRPTCHKQFDEATAILAGDGLLTYAFDVGAKTECSADLVVKAISILANKAGSAGMVLGQDLDMSEETGTTDWEALKKVHRYKTGCLLEAPLMIGAVLSGHQDDVEQWEKIGEIIGLAFQVQDDILDIQLSPEEFGKSTSDSVNDKVTSVSLLGMEEAESMMNELYDSAIHSIQSIGSFQSESLVKLIQSMKERRS